MGIDYLHRDYIGINSLISYLLLVSSTFNLGHMTPHSGISALIEGRWRVLIACTDQIEDSQCPDE